jgi:hypothetical protein
LPPGDYYAIVSRGDTWPDRDVYPWSIRQRLPLLPIHPDACVDLAAVFTAVYEGGRYARSLPYDEPIPVPLNDDDREWALDRISALRPVGPPKT